MWLLEYWVQVNQAGTYIKSSKLIGVWLPSTKFMFVGGGQICKNLTRLQDIPCEVMRGHHGEKLFRISSDSWSLNGCTFHEHECRNQLLRRRQQSFIRISSAWPLSLQFFHGAVMPTFVSSGRRPAYKAYSLEQMTAACKSVIEDGVGIPQAANQHGVPYRTLCRYVKSNSAPNFVLPS